MFSIFSFSQATFQNKAYAKVIITLPSPPLTSSKGRKVRGKWAKDDFEHAKKNLIKVKKKDNNIKDCPLINLEGGLKSNIK